MPSRSTRRLLRSRGNAMVEFAVIAPMLALFLCGVLETAFYGVVFLSVENAARSAAMRNSFGTDSATDQTAACAIVTEELKSVLMTSGSMPADGCGAAPLVVTSVLCGNGVACTGAQMSVDGKPAVAVTVHFTIPSWVPFHILTQVTRTAEMKIRGL